MPTYEYQCKTCGHRFDYFQAISADALTTCLPELCFLEDDEKKGTGVVVRRVSGGAGLVFKGEGFYLTDYVRKGDGRKDGSSSTGSSSGSKPDGGSSGGGGEKGPSGTTPAGDTGGSK